MNFPFLCLQIPPNDPRITNRRDCLPFFRSAAACTRGRAVREQINALTSFLDGSGVYGSEAAVAERLRDRSSRRGLLAVNRNFTDRGRAYLPFGPMRKEPCLKASGAAKIPCFLAGELGACYPKPGIWSKQFHQLQFTSSVDCFSYLSRKLNGANHDRLRQAVLGRRKVFSIFKPSLSR